MSAYSSGMQNARDVFEHFVYDQVHVGFIASAAGDQTVTGLGFTPDWVIATVGLESDLLNVGWSATANTLTFTKSATTACSISYICGNLS